MIYIIWSDYDGSYVEKFPDNQIDEAEVRITELVAKEEDSDNNGMTIDLLVEGHELTYNPIKTVIKHKIVRKQITREELNLASVKVLTSKG